MFILSISSYKQLPCCWDIVASLAQVELADWGGEVCYKIVSRMSFIIINVINIMIIIKNTIIIIIIIIINLMEWVDLSSLRLPPVSTHCACLSQAPRMTWPSKFYWMMMVIVIKRLRRPVHQLLNDPNYDNNRDQTTCPSGCWNFKFLVKMMKMCQ